MKPCTSAALLLASLTAAASTQVLAANPLSIINPADVRDERSVQARGNLFFANDQVPVEDYGHEWTSPYRSRIGRNLGLYTTRLELGATWDGWSVNALSRSEWLAWYNRETSDLYHQYSQGALTDPRPSWNVSARLEGFQAEGLKLGRAHILQLADTQVKAGWAVSLLKGDRVRVEQLSGLAALTRRGIGFNGFRDQAYSRMNTEDPTRFNPFVPRESFSGTGASLDAGFEARLSPEWRLSMAANDLLGAIQWAGVPATTLQYDTSATTFDSRGGKLPVASATDAYRNFRQTLHAKYLMELGYQVPTRPGLELTASAQVYRGNVFPQIGGRWALAHQWAVQAAYDTRFGTLTLGVGTPWLRLWLGTDRFDSLKKARNATLGLEGSIPF